MVSEYMNNPWDQQDDEPEAAFHYFTTYLKLVERPRRLRMISDLFNLAYKTIQNYSIRYNWLERARLHDAVIFENDNMHKREVLQIVQDEVTKDGLDDYRNLRQLWTLAASKLSDQLDVADEVSAEHVGSINQLALGRERINRLGRAVAQLPNTYRDVVEVSEPERSNEPMYLHPENGPMLLEATNAKNNTASVSSSTAESS